MYKIREIYISCTAIMNGYYNNNGSNQKSIITINNQRYIKTCDFGYLDKDGFLFIKGREKKFIKYQK